MVYEIKAIIDVDIRKVKLISETVSTEMIARIQEKLESAIDYFHKSFVALIVMDEGRGTISATLEGQDFRYERMSNIFTAGDVIMAVQTLGIRLNLAERTTADEADERNGTHDMRYVCFHFPFGWVENVLEQCPDFWEEFTGCILMHHDAQCGTYDNGMMTASIPENVYEKTLQNTANTMTRKYGMANIWDKVIVQERKLVRFAIMPEEHCEEEILRKKSDFFSAFSAGVEKVKGVKVAYYLENVINVCVFEEHIFDLLDFIEDFMWKACEITDPYNVLIITVRDKAVEAQVKNYIQSYNNRMVEELFADLERRLTEEAKEKATEKSAERTKGENTMRKQENRCTGFEYPVKFSPEMMTYITELRQVTQALDQINNLPQFYTKSLLVSMDDGWGYSAFLKAIRDELLPYYNAEKDDIDVEEVTVSATDGMERWVAVPKAIKTKAGNVVERRKFSIASFDIRDWMSEVNRPELLDCLRKIGQYSDNILCVFRIPYMDAKVVRNIEEQMSSVLSLRTIIVPPVSVENMVIYLKDKIRESRFMIDEACDEWLEQWICQEKNEGNFFGYKTLDKMSGELIYHKALHDDGSKVLTFIDQEDIAPMLTEQFADSDAYELLEELIGIAQVKTRVREIVAQIKLQKNLEEQGKSVEKPTMHMMFTGNPGTGKTTVARIIGRILKQEGILHKGQFFEKQGNDFVGKYIGHSAPLVRASCRDAYGSVLFIDEAYGMAVEGTKWNSGAEVVATFISEMENHRDDLCVIMAGYTDEMQEFMKVNSGLESRIPHVIEFPNYTRDELVQIFFKMVDGNFEYEEALKETLVDYINSIPEENFETKEFSNGRFVRNLYEHLWGKAAYRISLSGETDIILKKEDMVSVIEEETLSSMMKEKSKKKIGFQP